MNNSGLSVIYGTTRRKKKRIMAVDDEKDVVFCLSKILQETGLFDVDGFTDSQHALSSFKPGKYDLVILILECPKWMALNYMRNLKIWTRTLAYVFLLQLMTSMSTE